MNNKEITKNNLTRVKELIEDVQEMSEKDYQKILDNMMQFREYSFCNQILLMFAGASQVAGYHRWKELKRNVKKGAKTMTNEKTKRYWVMNIRTLEEKVVSAHSLKEAAHRLNWEGNLIKICKVWYNKPYSELILDY